jgi:hypothetical protein
MKQNWMIEITVDGCITGRVGPFDAECVADMYCAGYLEPAMPNAKFLITDLDDPEKLWKSIGSPAPAERRSS